jgi:hypothetical protein
VSTPSPAAQPPSLSTVASPSGEASPGFFARLVGLYVAPTETFRAIAAHPTFLAPLLAILLVNSAFTFVWLRKADHVQLCRTQLEDAGIFDRFPPEQHAAILERQVRLLPMLAWVGLIVGVPVVTAVMALVFLFIYRFFYASETTFTQSLAALTWALLTYYLLLTLLVALVMTLKDEWSVDPHTVIQASLGALVEKSAVPKTVYVLLGELDLAWAWLLFLVSAGYAAASQRSVGSAAGGVLVLWGISVLFKVAWAAVF